jgi:hypothetical protein
MDDRQFEYQSAMNALHFTQEQKAALAARTAQSAGTRKYRKPHPLRKIAVIAAAAVLVLAVGVGAGAFRSAADALAGVFGTERTEIIDRIGRPIDAGASDDGITVTADAIIGDKYSACVVYSISRDDGQPLGLPEGCTPLCLCFQEERGSDLSGLTGAHGSAWFEDDDPADNAVQYIEAISSDGEDGLRQGRVTADFRGLACRDENGEETVLSGGHWKFSFNVNYEDSSVTLAAGQTFTQNGMNYTVDAASISPVALRVAYTVDHVVEWDYKSEDGRESEHDREQERLYFESVEILVTMKDGSVLDMSDSGGSVSPKDDCTECVKSGIFSQVLDLSEVESVSVGGVVLPVSAD